MKGVLWSYISFLCCCYRRLSERRKWFGCTIWSTEDYLQFCERQIKMERVVLQLISTLTVHNLFFSLFWSPTPRPPKNNNRLTQSDRKAIGQCAPSSPKSTRRRITEKYDGLRDHRMVTCCMAFVSFVLTVKLLLPFLKRSSVLESKRVFCRWHARNLYERRECRRCK